VIYSTQVPIEAQPGDISLLGALFDYEQAPLPIDTRSYLATGPAIGEGELWRPFAPLSGEASPTSEIAF
jgi:hypothetical protein